MSFWFICTSLKPNLTRDVKIIGMQYYLLQPLSAALVETAILFLEEQIGINAAPMKVILSLEYMIQR